MYRLLLVCLNFLLATQIAVAVSPVPQQIAPPSTTCKVYALAHEFAKFIQPTLSDVQSKSVWDALRLDFCNSSWIDAAPPMPFEGGEYKTKPAESTRRKPQERSDVVPTWYVDPNKGSDQNAGTLDKPLKTIHAALHETEGSQPAKIILRGGVYHLSSTIALTAKNSHLSIEAFVSSDNGVAEVPEISGTSSLTGQLDWKPYNVTPGSGVSMSVLPNTNLVYGATFGKNSSCIDFVGKTPSAQACSDICKTDKNCAAFTWHDDQQPAGSVAWDEQCYIVHKGCAHPAHGETHHMSGIKTENSPMNIYVAHGAWCTCRLKG
jgi:hypothetical protein